jgi:hypothetical protein
VRPRALALVLVAAAAAVHLLLTVPLQRQAGADGDEYRRQREQRRQAQARLARLERGETLRRQAAAVLAGGSPEDTVRRVRRSLIGSLEGAPVSNVRLSVRPGLREQVAAAVTLNAEGGFGDVVRLSGQVARAGSGLLLQSVTFSARPPTVGLTIEALGAGGRS